MPNRTGQQRLSAGSGIGRYNRNRPVKTAANEKSTCKGFEVVESKAFSRYLKKANILKHVEVEL